MNDAIAGPQGDAAAGLHEVRQGVLGVDVHRFRIGGGVTKGLHYQVGRKTQAGEVFQLVPGHGSGSVLATYSSHPRLAVATGSDTLDTAGLAHHLLCQGKSTGGFRGGNGGAEYIGGRQFQRFTSPLGETATDDQRDSAAGTNFIQQHFRL